MWRLTLRSAATVQHCWTALTTCWCSLQMSDGWICRLDLMRDCVNGSNERCQFLGQNKNSATYELLRVVVDDAEREACAAADAADAMAKRNAIVPFCATDGPIARCEDDAVALVGRDDFGSGLSARHIFHEDKFAAVPIASLLAKHQHQLQRKRHVTI